MENQEVQKFDPATLMQGVKDRIKATFVSLIPDEQWNIMVQKEIDEFFKSNKDRYTYGNRDKMSSFEFLVQECIQEESKKRLIQYLQSEEFNTTWGKNGQVILGEAIKNMIVNNSGEIMINTFGNMFKMMLDNFKIQLQQNRY